MTNTDIEYSSKYKEDFDLIFDCVKFRIPFVSSIDIEKAISVLKIETPLVKDIDLICLTLTSEAGSD